MLTIKILYELWPYFQHFDRLAEDKEYQMQVWLKAREMAAHIASADAGMYLFGTFFLCCSLFCAMISPLKLMLDNINANSIGERLFVYLLSAVLNNTWAFMIVGLMDFAFFAFALIMPDPRVYELLKQINGK